MASTIVVRNAGRGLPRCSSYATVEAVCRLILQVVPQAEHAGITIDVWPAFDTIAANSNLPLRVDHIRYEAGRDPCANAITEREAVRCRDVGKEGRTSPAGHEALMSSGTAGGGLTFGAGRCRPAPEVGGCCC